MKNNTEQWDKAKCEKMAKRKFKDAYGTINNIRGLQQYFPDPVPLLHEDFEWDYVNTWGLRISKKGTDVWPEREVV